MPPDEQYQRDLYLWPLEDTASYFPSLFFFPIWPWFGHIQKWVSVFLMTGVSLQQQASLQEQWDSGDNVEESALRFEMYLKSAGGGQAGKRKGKSNAALQDVKQM